ncbi:MAG: MBL fold metallo-hydrolase, partial [Clostridia bacterium]|nr:MBL fold metallo-hydrolase [Clostridia bacterium]
MVRRAHRLGQNAGLPARGQLLGEPHGDPVSQRRRPLPGGGGRAPGPVGGVSRLSPRLLAGGGRTAGPYHDPRQDRRGPDRVGEPLRRRGGGHTETERQFCRQNDRKGMRIAMKITYLGHASFLLETAAGTRIVTDPYAQDILPHPVVKAHVV